jgi:two-component system sensor histidine kinase/response regulator
MKRILLGVVFFWLPINTASAQTFSASDTLRVDSLNARSFAFIGNSPDSMIQIAERALDLSKRLRYRKGEAFALNRIAIGKHLRGETNTIDLLDEALKIQTELGDAKARIGTLSNMANIHIATGAYVFAGERLHESLATYASLGDSLGMANVWNNLGNLHRSMGQLEKALDYNRLALGYRERAGDTLLLSSSLNNVGNLLTDLNQLDEAKQHHERALVLNRAIGDKRSIANSLHNLGTIYIKQGNYRLALEYYKNAASLREDIKDMRALTSALSGQAEAYIGLKNYTQAIASAERSYTLARQIGVPKEASEASRMAFLAHRDGGNPNRALEFLEIHKHLSDSLVTLDRQKAIANLESVAELNRKKDELNILEQERIYQRNLLLFICIGLIVALFLLGWIYRSRVRERRIIEELRRLGEMKDQMFSILSHDLRSPLNSLHSMIELMDMEALTADEWRAFKDTLIRQFDVTDDTLRDVLLWAKGQFEGEKSTAQSILLKEAVDSNVDLVNLIATRKGVTIQVDVDASARVLADRAHLMAIIRNLLTNAVKYTPSGNSVQLRNQTLDGNQLLFFEDQGMGMTPEQMETVFTTSGQFTQGTGGETGSGLGLVFVRDLVRRNKGTIHVSSELGVGSTFKVALPSG